MGEGGFDFIVSQVPEFRTGGREEGKDGRRGRLLNDVKCAGWVQ